jgi:hypothetical protein
LVTGVPDGFVGPCKVLPIESRPARVVEPSGTLDVLKRRKEGGSEKVYRSPLRTVGIDDVAKCVKLEDEEHIIGIDAANVLLETKTLLGERDEVVNCRGPVESGDCGDRLELVQKPLGMGRVSSGPIGRREGDPLGLRDDLNGRVLEFDGITFG